MSSCVPHAMRLRVPPAQFILDQAGGPQGWAAIRGILLTADVEQERSIAMANQYFLECFWIQALGFLVVRADGTQVAVQGTSQAPWQSNSSGCRVCTQELNQPFRCLSPHLRQVPGPCPALTSTVLLVREPWAGMMSPFQLQKTRSRETKRPEFPRLLTAG